MDTPKVIVLKIVDREEPGTIATLRTYTLTIDGRTASLRMAHGGHVPHETAVLRDLVRQLERDWSLPVRKALGLE